MSMELVARTTLRRQMTARGGDVRSLADRALITRIWRFAARHHRRLAAFVAVSIVTALLTVATPMLAGRVVDTIVRGGPATRVVVLALVIAAVALAKAAVSLLTRWLSSTIGEGLILDLRTAVFDHVQRMPIAFFTRTRTGALVSRLGNGRAAFPRRRDPQRHHEHADDRALFGARRNAGETVRQSGAGIARIRGARVEEVAVLDDRGGDEVLHGISFTAKPGQMVALVGSSGAGKSTIASLCARLYDVDSGSVKLNHVDVRDLTFASLRETVGVVTQDGHLFHESIRSNLLLAAPHATDDELWEVLRRARLADVVAQMPDGLDTVVGERGYRLSGGQRQRLTIARLLLGRARVVVLDEATASLDSTSEAAVQQALSEALAGRTSIVIAHRLSTVRAADVILVVEDGRIVERGTHERLLARGGRYAELYLTQFGDDTAAA